mgnify:FL=1
MASDVDRNEQGAKLRVGAPMVLDQQTGCILSLSIPFAPMASSDSDREMIERLGASKAAIAFVVAEVPLASNAGTEPIELKPLPWSNRGDSEYALKSSELTPIAQAAIRITGLELARLGIDLPFVRALVY